MNSITLSGLASPFGDGNQFPDCEQLFWLGIFTAVYDYDWTETDRRFRLAFSTQPVRPVLHICTGTFTCDSWVGPVSPLNLNRYWYPTAKRNPFVCSQLLQFSSRFCPYSSSPAHLLVLALFIPSWK
jgi:hypothetical protein